jgi:23S rRNA (guanine745-N1)-methyltransferase
VVDLLCPVRECGEILARSGRTLLCPRRHSFDVARSGYINLLQPQDRRSKSPGDSPAAVAARHRFHAAGHEEPLVRMLLEMIATLPLPAHPAVLDVGCGDGYHLRALAAAREIDSHGLDLSVSAVDLAARLAPGALWVVANADRFLPYAPGSFGLVLSLTARMNPPELRRVLAPEGRALVAVPGADDLVELRQAVLGEGRLRDRAERTVADFAGDFELESHRTVRYPVRLDAAGVVDLLSLTYREARDSRRERAAALDGLDVTLSRDLLVFRPRA